MTTVKTFALTVPYEGLLSLQTSYNMVGCLRDLLERGRGPGFHARVWIKTRDGAARAWAACAPGATEFGTRRSGKRGTFATEEILARLDEPEDVVAVERGIDAYLRTLVQVLHAAADQHQALWELTQKAWSDSGFSVTGERAQAAAGDFHPVPVSLPAGSERELRAAFEDAMLEAIAPWTALPIPPSPAVGSTP